MSAVLHFSNRWNDYMHHANQNKKRQNAFTPAGSEIHTETEGRPLLHTSMQSPAARNL